MSSKYFRNATVSILAGFLILVTPGIGATASLAGSKGDTRYTVSFPAGTIGGCQKAYKAYVAANGHSAYAATPLAPMVEYFICGAHLNAASQKAAEALALKSCQSTRNHYKVTTAGPCGIAASK